MTTATFDVNDNRFEITVDGHADYNPGGPDIVCSACSTLCCALAQSILEMDAAGQIYTEAGFALENTPGHFRMLFTAHTWAADKAKILVDHTLSAFFLLENQYPHHVLLRTGEK
jgi:uncharacterized protein YsxB (DUF464 family)